MIATNLTIRRVQVTARVGNVTEADNVENVTAGDIFQIMITMMKNVGIAEVAANVDFVAAKAITDKNFA